MASSKSHIELASSSTIICFRALIGMSVSELIADTGMSPTMFCVSLAAQLFYSLVLVHALIALGILHDDDADEARKRAADQRANFEARLRTIDRDRSKIVDL